MDEGNIPILKIKRRDIMPNIESHIKKSIERTGKTYDEIHKWIDDPEHKDERHDITRVLEFGRMFEDKFGKEAAQEYVQHLADDLNGKFSHLIEDAQSLVDKTLTYFGTKKQ
jgi:glutaredoxin 2